MNDFQRVLLLGRIWGLIMETWSTSTYVIPPSRQEFIDMLQGERGEEVYDKYLKLINSYGEIVELFNEIVPCYEEED